MGPRNRCEMLCCKGYRSIEELLINKMSPRQIQMEHTHYCIDRHFLMHGHESRQAFIFFLIFLSCTTSFTFTPLESENLRSADTKVLVVDYANIIIDRVRLWTKSRTRVKETSWSTCAENQDP